MALSPNVLDQLSGRNVGKREVFALDVELHPTEANKRSDRRIDKLLRAARHLLSFTL